ncbi:hypothetical protein LCGC14_3045890, partial [marine sediment metagenome]
PLMSSTSAGVYCTDKCAWFQMEGNYIYCGEKFMGEIDK